MKYSFSGLILVVIGALALAHNLGFLNVNLAHLLRDWWPVLLIALGLSMFFPGSRRR